MLQTADVLLVIDFQNGVCKEPKNIFNLQECITGINNRISAYRETNKFIIFIQHNDEELIYGHSLWKIISEINTQSNDCFVQKTHANSFYHTELRKILNENNVKSLEICGAQTEFCVDTTIKIAHGLGYDLQMQKGLSTTFDNAYMTAQNTVKFYEHIWNNRFLKLF